MKFCLTYYFKLYFDIEVKLFIKDALYHILTSLRILRSQPKKVKDIITFYVRTGAWYAHPDCVLLSRPNPNDRKFAMDKILQLRGGEVKDNGDNSVRPRITPKLNLSANTP